MWHALRRFAAFFVVAVLGSVIVPLASAESASAAQCVASWTAGGPSWSSGLYYGYAAVSVTCDLPAVITVHAETYGTGLNVNTNPNDSVKTATCIATTYCSVSVWWVGQLPGPTDVAPICAYADGYAVADGNGQLLTNPIVPYADCVL